MALYIAEMDTSGNAIEQYTLPWKAMNNIQSWQLRTPPQCNQLGVRKTPDRAS